MNDNSVSLSGRLQLCPKRLNQSAEEQKVEWTDVRLLVYRTANQHYAIISPLVDSVCAQSDICFINLKRCLVTVEEGTESHKVWIETKPELNNLRLVLEIDANQNIGILTDYMRPKNPLIFPHSDPFGLLPLNFSTSTWPMEMVEEDCLEES